MEENIISLFKKKIVKHEKEKRRTRASNLVGHLAKREDMRVWFYERYPNPSDWTTFFHEHQKHFIYDETTGNFKVNINTNYMTKHEVNESTEENKH